MMDLIFVIIYLLFNTLIYIKEVSIKNVYASPTLRYNIIKSRFDTITVVIFYMK